MKPQEIAEVISRLTAEELVELKRILDEGPGGGEFIGVREPRRPSPEGDEAEGWPEPAPLPEDYWESAQ